MNKYLSRGQTHGHVSSDQNPGWLGYIGDYTSQLYTDYHRAVIRIPINQPGFHGMSLRVLIPAHMFIFEPSSPAILVLLSSF